MDIDEIRNRALRVAQSQISDPAAIIAAWELAGIDVPYLCTAVGALRGMLHLLVDHESEPCRLDHEGYCQAHGLTRPCTVATAKELLTGMELL